MTGAGDHAMSRPAWARWYLPTIVGLTIVIGALAVYEFIDVARSQWARDWAFGNGDLVGYLDGARRFLETGSPYLPEQIAGPWQLGPHSFIHPPPALVLMVPFLWLPAILWWAIPLVVTIGLVALWRPQPWTWPLIALCLLWPRSPGLILTGNTDLWATMFVALGVQFGWPFVLLVIKPTFAPLALLAVRARPFWIGVVVCAIAMLPFLGLWFQYIPVVRNTDVDATYSLLNLPLVAIPVIAWFGRTRFPERSR